MVVSSLLVSSVSLSLLERKNKRDRHRRIKKVNTKLDKNGNAKR